MKKYSWILLSILGLGAIGTYYAQSTEQGAERARSETSQVESLPPSENTEIQAMRAAMLSFKNSLSKDLLDKASNPLNSKRFLQWHNTPVPGFGGGGVNRDGIFYGDLSEEQLSKFKTVLGLFLSKKGYQKVEEITVLAEGFLHEVRPNFWSPDFYSIDLFGDPEKDESWGFQLDGHHCAINFLVHGENVSMVPAFLGGEPVRETLNGKAFDIFKSEREIGLNLYKNFTKEEREAAESTQGKAGLQVGPARRPRDLDPHAGEYDYSPFKKGLKLSEASKQTAETLKLLMQEYVNNLSTTFADVWWKDIEENLDETYFVWIDKVEQPTETSQFYYRIYNPYLWVEFNIQQPIDRNLPSWNHVHSITRIPNNPKTKHGGDYGIFAKIINNGGIKMLFEHYASADHHKQSERMFDYELVGEHLHSHRH